MPDNDSVPTGNAKPSLQRSGVARIAQVTVSTLILGMLLFLSAGRLDWLWAWVFLAVWTIALAVFGIWMARKNPDLLNERGRQRENVKPWDKALMAVYSLILFLMPVVAGLDAGRFGWSAMPLAVQVIGLVGYVPAMGMTLWSMSTNPFLATFVRIQDDRGHRVVTSGPYRYVRHPMYVGTLLWAVCTPLVLGSWWALIPGGLIAALFVLRTALEDKTLREELPGYAEYARQVRYRRLPGVW